MYSVTNSQGFIPSTDYFNKEVFRNAITPSQTTVDVANGTWIFMGYDRDSAVADMTTADSEGNVTFTGSWKFVEKSDTPSAPDNGDQNGANGGDKPQVNPNDKSGTAQEADSPLPSTGDSTTGFAPRCL